MLLSYKLIGGEKGAYLPENSSTMESIYIAVALVGRYVVLGAIDITDIINWAFGLWDKEDVA